MGYKDIGLPVSRKRHNNKNPYIFYHNNNNHSSLLSLWNLKIMKDALRLLSFLLRKLPYAVTIAYLYRFLLFHNYFNNVCVHHLYYTRSPVLTGPLHINHSCPLPLPLPPSDPTTDMSDTWETATPRRRRPPLTHSTAAANTHNVDGFEYLTSDNFEKYFNEKAAPHLAGIEEKVRNSFRLQLNTNEEIKQNLAETRAQTAPLHNEIEGQKLEIAHLQATINELRDVVKSLSTTPRVPNPTTLPPHYHRDQLPHRDKRSTPPPRLMYG
jgi:hypothetical protein